MNFDRLFLFRTTFSLIILALLPGCVANRPYRLKGVADGIYERKFPGQQQPSREYEAMPDHKYRLSFVEFDEKGDFWDRGQLAIAASRIKHSPKPVLLVVFIHGWHHNAADRPENTKNPGDVQTFKCLLSQLAVSESTRGLDVHGVYLGWRGRLVQGPLDYVTFLGRKGAATRIAGTPVTETIFELIRQARRRAPGASKTVVIGHSFGALVLEKRWRRRWAASSRRTRRPAAAPSALPPISCCWLIPLRNRSTRKSSPTCFESSGIADTSTPTARCWSR